METKIDNEDQHGEGYLKGIRYLPEERGGRNYVEDPYNKGVAMYIFPEDVRLINVEMTVKRANVCFKIPRSISSPHHNSPFLTASSRTCSSKAFMFT